MNVVWKVSTKVYISGPITGIPDGNKEAFEVAERVLREKGYAVFNPRRHVPQGLDWATAMRSAIKLLLECDAIYLLSDWSHSKGAQVEYGLAKTLGMTIIFPGTEIRGRCCSAPLVQRSQEYPDVRPLCAVAVGAYMKTWFSFNGYQGAFDIHTTEAEAKKAAKDALDGCRPAYPDDGWSDDVTENIYYGRIVGRVIETMHKEVPVGVTVDDDGIGSDGVDYSDIPSGVDCLVDYELFSFR